MPTLASIFFFYLVFVGLALTPFLVFHIPDQLMTIGVPALLFIPTFILLVRVSYSDWMLDVTQFSPRLHVLRYILQLLESSHQRMDISTRDTADTGYPFDMLFCDISSYFIEGRPMPLSRWIAETQASGRAYGGVLLGPPGAGKSISLQAISLSCANSYFFCSIVPLFFRQGGKSSDLIRRVTGIQKHFRYFFESTWLFGAPPLVPVLVPLRQRETFFSAYAASKDRTEASDRLLDQLLSDCEGLNREQFLKLLGQGRIALLLDGLDELTTEPIREAALDFAGRMFARRSDAANLVIVSCREGSYTARLQDLTPRAFDRILLGELTNDDKRSIVKKIITADWHRTDASKSKTLLSRTKHVLRRRRGILGYLRVLHRMQERDKLFEDLVHEIINLLSRAFSGWSPTSNPLSLRRVTMVLLLRPANDLRLTAEPPGEPRWRLEVRGNADSLFDYTWIIELDLLEFIARRLDFCDDNRLTPLQLLDKYGELAYTCAVANRGLSAQDIRSFVKTISRASQSEAELSAQVDSFILPGIITPSGADGGTAYTFRDEESERFVTAAYMLGSPSVAEKMDQFISQANDKAFAEGTLQMLFGRLKGEAFDRFIETTRFFSSRNVLHGVIAGQTGAQPSGAISPREGQTLLRRCLRELRETRSNGESIRLWMLVRHLVFKRSINDGVGPDLLAILECPQASGDNKAQATLVLAEAVKCFSLDRTAEVAGWLQEHARSDHDLLACSAILAHDLLFPEAHSRHTFDEEMLWLSVPSGRWATGHTYWYDDKPNQVDLPAFKLARFPFLTYQLSRFRGGPDESVAPGEAFQPAVGVSLKEIEVIAGRLGAHLPSCQEYEVAAAHTGGSGRRRYPWGNAFELEHADICYAERRFRHLLGTDRQPLPVALKPLLATPSGIFDLVANVIQLSSDRARGKSGVEILGFGFPAKSSVRKMFECSTRPPVPADGGLLEVGFRLARHV